MLSDRNRDVCHEVRRKTHVRGPTHVKETIHHRNAQITRAKLLPIQPPTQIGHQAELRVGRP